MRSNRIDADSPLHPRRCRAGIRDVRSMKGRILRFHGQKSRCNRSESLPALLFIFNKKLGQDRFRSPAPQNPKIFLAVKKLERDPVDPALTKPEGFPCGYITTLWEARCQPSSRRSRRTTRCRHLPGRVHRNLLRSSERLPCASHGVPSSCRARKTR